MQSVLKGDAWSKSIRLAINVNDWTPTEAEWTKAINSVQVVITKGLYNNDWQTVLVGLETLATT